MSASSVSPGEPICGSNAGLSEHVSTILFHPSKPLLVVMFVQLNLLVIVLFVQVNQ